MSALKTVFGWFVFLCTLWTSMAFGAIPFSSPAAFDLQGSTLAVSGTLDTPRKGTQQIAINPNPSPVTGQIQINTLDRETGIFGGALNNITATSMATVEAVSLDVEITVIINSQVLRGIFIWEKDRVSFYPESISVTVQFGDQSREVSMKGIPFSGTYDEGLLILTAQFHHEGDYLTIYTYALDFELNLTGHLPAGSAGDAWLYLATNQSTYFQGETLQLYVGLEYVGTNQPVDFYLGMMDPAGNLLVAPGYTTDVTPLLSSFMLEGPTSIDPIPLTTVQLSSTLPPIQASGHYQFLAALFKAGTFELIGNLASAELSYYQSPSDPAITGAPYDGDWYGTGASEVTGEYCPTSATLHFLIVDNRISGEASEVAQMDADSYEVSGKVTAEGNIVEGILLEEFGASLIPVGTFSGQLSVSGTGGGTWVDDYGCYGTFTVTRQE
jgi:hypothetical protein